MKTALRWIFLIPLAALAAICAYFVPKLYLLVAPFIPFDWLQRFMDWWIEIIASLMLGSVFITAAYHVAPRWRLPVAYAMAGIGIAYIAMCVWGDWRIHGQIQTRSIVGTLLGVVFGLAECHKAERQECISRRETDRQLLAQSVANMRRDLESTTGDNA